MKFYPYLMGGGGGQCRRGYTQSFGMILTGELEFLAILNGGGGRKTFPPFKRGDPKDFTLS